MKKSAILAFLISILLTSCAVVVTPTGGPKDEQGPLKIYVDPAHESTNFNSKKIVFQFDEYLSNANLSNEIFISPLPKEQPKMYVKGKKIIIKFKDELAENSTYVITLGRGITDLNEKNPLPEAIQYAFSTGKILDSCSVKGKITNAFDNKPAKDLLVMLYEIDSIPGNDFLKKTPIYLTQTDENGNFNLSYLKKKKYKILGVKDVDNSFSYNLETESYAQAISHECNFDSSTTIQKNLFFSEPFPKKIKLKKVSKVSEHTAKFEFSAAIKSISEIKFSCLQENSHENLIELVQQKVDDSATVYVCFKDTFMKENLMKLENINGYFGQKSDTEYVFTPVKLKRKIPLKFKRIKLPIIDSLSFFCNEPIKKSQLDSLFQLRDTANNIILPQINTNGLFLMVFLPETLSTKFAYSLKFDKNIESIFGLKQDTGSILKIQVENKKAYSQINGKILTDKNLIIQMSGGGKTYTSLKNPFKFDNVKPGKYRIKVIFDEDSNHVWTPGNLENHNLPEKVFLHENELDLRAGWDYENIEIPIIPES